MNKIYFSLEISQAAAILGISAATVRNWHKAGLLSRKKKGKKFVYARSEVEKLKKDIALGRVQRLKQRANKKAKTDSRIHKELGDKKSIQQIRNICSELQKLALTQHEILSTLGILLLKKAQGLPHIKTLNLTTPLGEKELDRLYMRIPDNAEIDVLGVAYQHLRTDGNKAQAGAIYTPLWVSQQQVETHLRKTDNFLDPCCGTGSYLLAAIRQLKKSGVRNWWKQIYGADIDALAVLCARINCQLEIPPHENASVTICCFNSLLENQLFFSLANHFDLIASNPPWGVHFSKQEINILKSRYPQIKSGESSSYFIALALNLLKGRGRLSYLLPEAICHTAQHKDIREKLLDTGLTAITAYQKLFKGLLTDVVQIDLDLDKKNKKINIFNQKENYRIPITQFKQAIDFTFDFYMKPDDFSIVQQIEQKDHRCLKAHATFAMGIVTGNNQTFLTPKTSNNHEPIYRGKNIESYRLKKNSDFIHFTPEQYQQCAPEKIYRAPKKLVYRFITDRLIVALDCKRSLFLNSANILIPDNTFDIKYVLAALNADYANFYFQKRFHSIKVLRRHLENIPIPMLAAKEQERVIAHVDAILAGEKKACHQEAINRLFNDFLEIELI